MFKKTVIALCLASILYANYTFAEEPQVLQPVETANKDFKINLEFTQGYRHDKLHKGVKGNHSSFKTKFRDIHSCETRLNSKLSWHDYFKRVRLGYGHIFWGHNRNSGRAGTHHKTEFFGTHSRVDGNHTLDAQIALGKDFNMDCMTISPLVGYAWDYQNIHMKKNHLHRIFDQKVSAKLRHTHLRSKDHWNAPLVGIRGSFKPMDTITLYGEYDFLFALKHKGHLSVKSHHAHDNLMHQSSKRSKGFGHLATVGAGYSLLKNCALKAEYQFSRLEARGGHAHARTRYNDHVHSRKATLTSQEVRLAFEYDF
jgi:hypothetical protein